MALFTTLKLCAWNVQIINILFYSFEGGGGDLLKDMKVILKFSLFDILSS